MALTAKFIADFSSFTQAVNRAEVELRGFEGSANKVGATLNKMTNSFSGTKIIQDAHLMTAAMVHSGGITALTDKELRKLSGTVGEAADKMRRMGIEVPPGFQKIQDAAKGLGTESRSTQSVLSGLAAQLAGMFTVGAVIAFGKEVIRAGDAIQKMADQTGLTVGQVQKLQYIAGQSGTSIESLVGAVQNLQQRLGDDNSGAVAGIKKLGINLTDLKALDPYQQMVTLAEGIRGIKDPAEQASVAAAIFGKTWKEILPAIKSGMQQVGEEAPLMADATVKALDRIGDTLTKAKGQAIVWGAGFVTAIENAAFAVGDFLSKFDPAHFGVANSQLLKMYGALNDPTGLVGATFRAGKGVKELTTATKVLAPVVEATAKEEGIFNERLRQSVKANEDAARAAKARADQLLAMSKAGLGAEFDWQRQIELTKWKLTQLVVEEKALYEQTRTLADFVAGHKGEMFPELPQSALDAWKTGQQTITDTAPKVQALDDKLSRLGKVFAQLAQTSGGSMGRIAQSIGTVIAAMELATQAGKEFKASLADAQGKGDGTKADGYAGLAVAALAAAGAIDAATNSTSKTVNVLSGAAAGAKAGAAAFGAYGAAAGAVAGALVGLIKSNASEGKHVSPLRDEFFKMAGGLEKLNPLVQKLTGNVALVQAVFDARTVQQYNAALAELNRLFEFQNHAMQTLDETVKKYNLTVEEMGPAFQRQELDKKARELFQDYEVLTKAGADHVVVVGKMAEAINDYIADAVKMGVEVPSAMKPMLQQMIDSGLLLDANGKKFGSLEEAGISFAMTMSEGFTSLIDEVKKLTDAIARGLGLAIKNIPDAEVEIRGRYIPPSDMRFGVHEMAAGGTGIVKKPTLFLAGEAGPEEFAFSGAGKKLGGGGGGATVYDFSEMKDRLDRQISDADRDRRRLPHLIGMAVRDALVQAG